LNLTKPDRNILQPTEDGIISQWAIGIENTFVSLNSRIRYERQMIQLTMDKPHLIASIFTGALARVIRSLPVEDPWRKLKIAQDYTVLSMDGEQFEGRSAYDLVDLMETTPRLQTDLAPMADEISDASKILIATATNGWEATLARAERDLLVVNPTLDEAAGIFLSLEGALRWACFRYETYVGPGSCIFSRSIAVGHLNYLAPMTNNTLDIETVDSPVDDDKIQDGSWALHAGREY